MSESRSDKKDVPPDHALSVLSKDMTLQFHGSLLFQQSLVVHGVHAGRRLRDLEGLVRDLGMGVSGGRRSVVRGQEVTGARHGCRVQERRRQQMIR